MIKSCMNQFISSIDQVEYPHFFIESIISLSSAAFLMMKFSRRIRSLIISSLALRYSQYQLQYLFLVSLKLRSYLMVLGCSVASVFGRRVTFVSGLGYPTLVDFKEFMMPININVKRRQQSISLLEQLHSKVNHKRSLMLSILIKDQQLFFTNHRSWFIKEIQLNQMLPYIFIGLALVFIVLYFITRKTTGSSAIEENRQLGKPEKINYGPLRIFYGSQTGTAAKLAQQLAEEATDQGFEPDVVDLKDVSIAHLEGNNLISIFLLSNTGEGDPPENCIRWMKIIKKKESLDEVKELDWKKVNFSVFGLGNTQYEHYNITGIEADRLLEQLGAKRIYDLGLGDDNCSLQDDYLRWRKDLWPSLKVFRKNHPLSEEALHEHHNVKKLSSQDHHDLTNLSKKDPVFANYHICFQKANHEPDHVKQEDLDFKTKHSLKAEKSEVSRIRQLRQDIKDGSTLELEIELKGQPYYDTAGNIALYSKNDPAIIKEIVDYFEIKEEDLDKKIGLTVMNEDKKVKLNFVPNTIRTLLEQSIDIQGRLTKSVLKKLSKLKSTDSKYFSDNCSPKTTEEYKRITQKNEPEHWCYLIKIIKEYKVELAFEDFVELSDSMAPRIFTIASHHNTQKNVIVAASLTENGLISKFFKSSPKSIRAEIRKSTFSDAMRWKKVIFIAAGTGLAPFRAYIQEKIYNVNKKKEGKDVNVPIITLFFGCKHETGDFIYKDQILAWRDQGVIDRLHLAFSRDSQKKVYVQNLLEREYDELKQLGHCKDTAIYLCGSLPMGNSIIEVLTKTFGAEKVKQMETEGRIVKQLW